MRAPLPKQDPACSDRRFCFILSDHGCFRLALSRGAQSSNHSWNDRIPTSCLTRFQCRANSSVCRPECKIRRTRSASSRGPRTVDTAWHISSATLLVDNQFTRSRANSRYPLALESRRPDVTARLQTPKVESSFSRPEGTVSRTTAIKRAPQGRHVTSIGGKSVPETWNTAETFPSTKSPQSRTL